MGVMLAQNWPDQLPPNKVRDKSSLIDLEARKQQGNRAQGVSQRERLSEKTGELMYEKARCDSLNPEKILEVIRLWEDGLTWKAIQLMSGVPERTARRHLAKLGYKRDYSFVSKKVKESAAKRPKEFYEKISITKITNGVAKGEKNPNWRGGIQRERSKEMHTIEYKLWRKAVFERDDYTCKGCGDKRGGIFNAHHILPRRDFPHLLFCINNGITLCKKCHQKTVGKEYLSVNIWKQRV